MRDWGEGRDYAQKQEDGAVVHCVARKLVTACSLAEKSIIHGASVCCHVDPSSNLACHVDPRIQPALYYLAGVFICSVYIFASIRLMPRHMQGDSHLLPNGESLLAVGYYVFQHL